MNQYLYVKLKKPLIGVLKYMRGINYCLHCGEKSGGKYCSDCSTDKKRQEMCIENAKIRHAAGLKDKVCQWSFNGLVTPMCGSLYALAGLTEPKQKEVIEVPAREYPKALNPSFKGSNFK